MPPPLCAFVAEAAPARAPGDIHLSGVAGRREADRHEVLGLVWLQRDDLGRDDQPTDRRRDELRDRLLAAHDRRGGRHHRHGSQRPGFEPGEATGQLVQEGHGVCSLMG